MNPFPRTDKDLSAICDLILGKKVLKVLTDKDKHDFGSQYVHSCDFILVFDEFSVAFESPSECCNEVFLESGFEELYDVVGEIVTIAEVVENDPPEGHYNKAQEVECWSFLKINHATLRWYGTSNGYYSVIPKATVIR